MGKSIRTCIACAALALFCREALRAESWTNSAGHAIEAKLVSSRDSTAVFELPDGKTMTVPLASLSVADQARVRAASRTPAVPAALQVEYAQCERVLQRLAVLQNAGRITETERRERTKTAMDRLAAACRGLQLAESEQDRILLAVAQTASGGEKQ